VLHLAIVLARVRDYPAFVQILDLVLATLGELCRLRQQHAHRHPLGYELVKEADDPQ
jgi:hypothetical protein